MCLRGGVGAVFWVARFRTGVAVRINLRGGGSGSRVLRWMGTYRSIEG